MPFAEFGRVRVRARFFEIGFYLLHGLEFRMGRIAMLRDIAFKCGFFLVIFSKSGRGFVALYPHSSQSISCITYII